MALQSPHITCLPVGCVSLDRSIELASQDRPSDETIYEIRSLYVCPCVCLCLSVSVCVCLFLSSANTNKNDTSAQALLTAPFHDLQYLRYKRCLITIILAFLEIFLN